MIIFTSPEFNALAEELVSHVKAKHGKFSVDRFPNQELRTVLHEGVAGEDCVVLGTCSPPEENLVSLLLLCDTLKREGARKVALVAPYLAYTRQDKVKPGHIYIKQ